MLTQTWPRRTVLTLFVTATSTVACSNPKSAHRGTLPHRNGLSGVVMARDGIAVPRAIVIATDRATGDELASTHTDSSGRFFLEIAGSDIALSAATTHAWAYLDTVDTHSRDIRIHISDQCASFRGHVRLDDPSPAPVLDNIRIGGFEAATQGLFGVEVAPDLSFEACLPVGEYYITLPLNFAERTILTMVPPAEALIVHAVSRKYSMSPPPVPLDLAAEAQLSVVDRVPDDLRLLGLGESNHGTADFMRERVNLSLALVEHRHFSQVLIEAGYAETLALDDYIRGNNVAIDTAVANLGYWMWSTIDFRAALSKLRDYNSRVLPSAQIGIVGIDVQKTKGAISELLSDPGILSDRDVSLLSQLEDQNGKRWLEFSPANRSLLRDSLEQVAAKHDQSGLRSLLNRQALAARSLLLSLNLVEQKGFWNRSRARDQGMAKMAEEVLSRDKLMRGVVWAHIGHLSREFVVGAPTMGWHLATALGAHYRVWALLGLEGSVRARSRKHNDEVIAHRLPFPPEYTVESVLSRSTPATDLAVGYWDFHRTIPVRAEWLKGLRWIREIGATYPEDRAPFNLRDLAALDGIILFRHVDPTTPFPVAPERRPSIK
jgi:erythromycin esterase